MISRRDFLKQSALMGGTLTLAGCGSPAPQTPEKEGSMTYRNLADEPVSLLGYGCMRWPLAADGSIDQEQVNALVDRAIEKGVNYFDTAPVYGRGRSEEVTGIALSRHPRDKWKIATKMSGYLMDFGPAQREESIKLYKESFRKLGVDVIDYYIIHGVGIGGIETFHKRFLDIGLLEYFMEERRLGHIRKLCFSFHGSREVLDYVLALHPQVHWDMVQIQMNYLDWEHASGRNSNASYLYAKLEELGIPVAIMEPLRGGSLASVPPHVANRLKALRPQDSTASWAFRFCGSYPGVLTVLSGMTYMEHLEDNLKTFSPLEVCSEEELALLENAASLIMEYPLVPCTACRYCMPCPYGIDIPGIFMHYNKCVNQGDVVPSTQDPTYRKARKAYLKSYAKALVPTAMADHCIGCGKCMSHCPQDIKIPHEIRRIDRYVEKLLREG